MGVYLRPCLRSVVLLVVEFRMNMEASAALVKYMYSKKERHGHGLGTPK